MKANTDIIILCYKMIGGLSFILYYNIVDVENIIYLRVNLFIKF